MTRYGPLDGSIETISAQRKTAWMHLSNRGRRNTEPVPTFRDVNIEAGSSGRWHRRTMRPDERALKGKKPHERRLARPVGSRRIGSVPASVQASPAMQEMHERIESVSCIARNRGGQVVSTAVGLES